MDPHDLLARRVTPAMVLTMLAKGASREAVLEAYPVLEPADIDACLLYAARLVVVEAASRPQIHRSAADGLRRRIHRATPCFG